MAKFMMAHINDGELGGKRILKAETAQLMHSRQFAPSPYVNGSGLGFYESWTTAVASSATAATSSRSTPTCG